MLGVAPEEGKVGDGDGDRGVGVGVGGEGKKSGEKDVNDVFSDYISRAKRRLGSISIKRHDSGYKGKDNNAKDDRRFSDYISRARANNNLRATSSTSIK